MPLGTPVTKGDANFGDRWTYSNGSDSKSAAMVMERVYFNFLCSHWERTFSLFTFSDFGNS